MGNTYIFPWIILNSRNRKMCVVGEGGSFMVNFLKKQNLLNLYLFTAESNMFSHNIICYKL